MGSKLGRDIARSAWEVSDWRSLIWEVRRLKMEAMWETSPNPVVCIDARSPVQNIRGYVCSRPRPEPDLDEGIGSFNGVPEGTG